MENYSLSDLAAVTNSVDGLGGAGGFGFLILILLFFMMGGNWNKTGEYGQYATAASQQEILYGQQFQNLGSMINKVGDGISSLGYSQLQQMDANTSSINGNITSEGRALQMQLCALNSNIDNKFAALEKSQLEQTIAAQQSQINQLSLASQMAGVVKYPMASTYAMLNNPFCSCGGCCAQ